MREISLIQVLLIGSPKNRNQDPDPGLLKTNEYFPNKFFKNCTCYLNLYKLSKPKRILSLFVAVLSI